MKNVRMVLGATALALSSALGAGSVFAQAQMPMGDHAQMPAGTPMASSDDMLTQGEIKRIDLVAGKLTIKHGEIRNLDMPGMTMVFAVAKPEMLTGLKVGDKVRFVVEQQNGKMVVTKIAPAS